MDQVDLLNAFTSGNGFVGMMNGLLPALNDANSAAAAVLALEGLYRIEADVKSGQFSWGFSVNVREGFREFLRKWRCDSPLDQAYTRVFNFNRVIPFLRSLTIFKTLEVPLFIDDYGKKRLMSHYIDLVNKHKHTQAISTLSRQHAVQVNIVYPSWLSWNDRQTIDIENIPINLDTPIVHVTHTVQKELIVESQMLKPSANKNSIEGIWFSPKYQLGNPLHSVYGGWAFETTLGKLGVSGLRQGEIVSYKQQVNFILYASDTVPPDPVMKATDNAVKLSQNDRYAYGAVSIFVPSRFLPQGFMPQGFMQGVITGPYQIQHGPFCVKEKRGEIWCCTEVF